MYALYALYTMATISFRVADETKNEVECFSREEKLEDISEAARKLVAIGLEEFYREKALKLLETGRATFLKAAKIARMNVWDFAELVKTRKITWIKDKELIKRDIQLA